MRTAEGENSAGHGWDQLRERGMGAIWQVKKEEAQKESKEAPLLLLLP